MSDFVPGTEQTWKVPPFEVLVGEGAYDWEYYITLEDEDIAEGDGFESADSALKAAMAKIGEIDLWRKPDYEDGGVSLWWDPNDRLYDAEHVTEVSGGCVSEYTFVGDYEGFKGDQWLKITVCPDDAPSSHPRVIVEKGVEQIGYSGGEQEILSTEEVHGEWPDIARPKATNPAEIKRRMLSLDGYVS